MISLIGVTTVAAACSSPTSPRDQIARGLAQRETQWRAAAIHAYAFDYDDSATVNKTPVRIEVQGDTVARVVARESGADMSLAGWPTIDSLFVRAHDVVGNSQYQVLISYDTQLGFPTRITANSSVPDSWFSLRVSNFVAGP
jgi:hypothetical protein